MTLKLWSIPDFTKWHHLECDLYACNIKDKTSKVQEIVLNNFFWTNDSRVFLTTGETSEDGPSGLGAHGAQKWSGGCSMFSTFLFTL